MTALDTALQKLQADFAAAQADLATLASAVSAAEQPIAPGFFVSPGGNDANDGLSIDAPFATLERAQSAMQASTMLKTIYLRAGVYNRTVPVTLTAADNGTTWSYYPPDGIDTAVLDGGSITTIFDFSGASGVTINGLKMQHVTSGCIFQSGGGGDSITIENCDLGFVAGADTSGAIVLNNDTNVTIRNNYIHDCAGNGMWLGAFDAGDTLDGLVVTGNVVLRAVQSRSDQGAIYVIMRSSGTTGGSITISNNFIRDYGASGLDNDAVGIYLADNTSHATVTGNIIGPPLEGALSAANRNNTCAIFSQGGSFNTVSGNIIDLGDSSMVAIEIWSDNSGNAAPGVGDNAGSTFTGNIVLSNFAGSLNTSSGGVTGFAYYQNGPAASYTIHNNVYHNYATGGAVFSNGQVVSDASPQSLDPQISGLTYTIAAGSPVFAAPVDFPPIVGGWGPSGFVIPAGTAPSSQTGAGSPPPPPRGPAFFVSPTGSDANPGTLAAPLATLEGAQAAMRNSSTKTTHIRAGSYSRSSTFSLTAQDSNTTYAFYPPDGVNSAVFDGGGLDIAIFNFNGASGVTIDGLKMQNVQTVFIATSLRADNTTIRNCDIGGNHSGETMNFGFGGFGPALVIGGANCSVHNNYVHDTASQGIAAFAFNAGDTIDGTVIDSNVCLRCVQSVNDGGAIYVNMRFSNVNGGHVTISNNYCKDYGAAGVEGEAIYLDDDASNCTVTGNILGPSNSSSVPFIWQINGFMNGGCANNWNNNIFDLGAGSNQYIVNFPNPGAGTGSTIPYTPTTANIFDNNIVIANYAGATTSNNLGANGIGYPEDNGSASFITIQNNWYHNYGGGDEVNITQGPVVSDPNPTHGDPQISGWTYAIAPGSPVFSAPVAFTGIKGGWGPPGFVIPQAGNPPSSPH